MGEQVYQGGQPVATAQEYYRQAADIATSAPPASQSQVESDILPLGVFAVSQPNAADSNLMIQLAITKEGVISGTYYNTATDVVRPLQGRADKKTQRAAWTFADGKNTDVIMETGVFNLTQDQTEVLVHFGNNSTQKWILIRLEEPKVSKSG
jgi:hypothetical protein